MTNKNQQHKKAMQQHKAKVDAKIEAADIERGVALCLTGNGKGKSSSAFGMVMRALGYKQKIGVVQFIKGVQLSGEELFLRDYAANNPEKIAFYQMGTGFTWNTQDRETDIAAAERTWDVAAKLLADKSYDLVVLDELTYMLSYDYLDKDVVLRAIQLRPFEQSVVVTGRDATDELKEIVDTVSQVRNIKHAFKAGIKARKGVDY